MTHLYNLASLFLFSFPLLSKLGTFSSDRVNGSSIYKYITRRHSVSGARNSHSPNLWFKFLNRSSVCSYVCNLSRNQTSIKTIGITKNAKVNFKFTFKTTLQISCMNVPLKIDDVNCLAQYLCGFHCASGVAQCI